jgi:hypothetical protein
MIVVKMVRVTGSTDVRSGGHVSLGLDLNKGAFYPTQKGSKIVVNKDKRGS